MHTLGQLRNIKDSELELMLSWRNAPVVRANMYTNHEITMQEHLAWWEKTKKREDHQYFMYQDQDSALGIVGFTEIDHKNSNCSWAFYAAPDAPRGTGSKMEFLAIEHVFVQLNLHKLYCEVLAFNSPVIKLHQKFGFQVEGIFREQHLGENGYVDIYRLGIISNEWLDRRNEMPKKLTGLQKG